MPDPAAAPGELSLERVCFLYATNFNEWRGASCGFELAEVVLKRLQTEGASEVHIKEFMLGKISAFNAHN